VFERLDPQRIVATAEQLARRVAERFPTSGLSRVAAELVAVSRRAADDAEWIRQPRWRIRIGVSALVILLLATVAAAVATLLPRPADATMAELIQASESVIQDLVFLGIAIYFLASLERRWKRRRALRSLHTLRSMAHIVDMHQLTKDPERITGHTMGPDTASSPERGAMTVFELSRYLDYSSEMLSLLSKSAALYAQDFDDPVTMATVTEIEALSTDLSRKIWQKIMILDRIAADSA
jgi:hypothetical protein